MCGTVRFVARRGWIGSLWCRRKPRRSPVAENEGKILKLVRSRHELLAMFLAITSLEFSDSVFQVRFRYDLLTAKHSGLGRILSCLDDHRGGCARQFLYDTFPCNPFRDLNGGKRHLQEFFDFFRARGRNLEYVVEASEQCFI